MVACGCLLFSCVQQHYSHCESQKKAFILNLQLASKAWENIIQLEAMTHDPSVSMCLVLCCKYS